MEKVLYSKYSNQRANEYRIRTDIIQTEKKRVVRKSPAVFCAKLYVTDMLNKYHALKACFQNSKFKANAGKMAGESVEFEYISGISYEKILDEKLEQQDEAGFYQNISDFAAEVRRVYSGEEFVQEEGFIEVFGDVDLPIGVLAARNIDIDLIFSNVLVHEGQWNVIDYEWTFEFLIPVNYLLWRAVREYVNLAGLRVQLTEEQIFRHIGIFPKEAIEYEKMESHFQFSYCYKDSYTLFEFQKDFGRGIVKAQNISGLSARQELLFRLQVYFDTGSDFNESQSIYFDTKYTDTGICKVCIPVDSDWKAVRIDPAQKSCLLKIIRLQAETKTKLKELKYAANGTYIQDNIILFDTCDPQIYVMDLETEVTEIKFEYQLQDVPDNGADDLNFMNQFLRVNKTSVELKNEVDYKSSIIRQKDEQIQERDRHIHERNEQIQERDWQIKERDRQIQERDGQIQERDGQVQERDEQIYERDEQIREKNVQIQQREEQIQEKDCEIKNLASHVDILNQEIAQYKSIIFEMEHSKSWKVTKPLRSVSNLVHNNKKPQEKK